MNPFGLVRYHVLFVIDIATRCVCIGGITSDPNGEWMKQVARNLTDMWDGFLPWQAIPHPRPGPTIHRGGTWGQVLIFLSNLRTVPRARLSC